MNNLVSLTNQLQALATKVNAEEKENEIMLAALRAIKGNLDGCCKDHSIRGRLEAIEIVVNGAFDVLESISNK